MLLGGVFCMCLLVLADLLCGLRPPFLYLSGCSINYCEWGIEVADHYCKTFSLYNLMIKWMDEELLYMDGQRKWFIEMESTPEDTIKIVEMTTKDLEYT